MTAPKASAKKSAEKARETAQTELTVASFVPAGRESFSLREIAEIWRCSIHHLSRLIDEKEILVPQENIDRAATRSTIRVPRASLVDFIKQRLTTLKKR
jgi:hypothetical protein